jgi:TonB-dependent receptor
LALNHNYQGYSIVAKLLSRGASQTGNRLSAMLYPTRRSALSLAIAVALALPGVSHAQAAPPATGELEEIVVTGIRASIESSIAVKEQSMSIVEAVTAEDIGKLPDTSIAESISRLPGLTSQRAEGRSSAISLRGTDPGFTTALMNGREQVSTGDNRSIEFDQYPSELINSVVVYKTPDSQLVGQGLAGTIDLRTVRPLDFGKRAVVMNVRGEMNSQGGDMGADADKYGYRASFSYIDQFMDNKLGVAFGFAHLESPLATEGYGTYEPWHTTGAGGAVACDGSAGTGCFRNPGVPAGTYVTDGIKVRSDMGTNTRDGFMGTVQFKPNDFYSTTLDAYYTTRDQTDNARSLEVNLSGYPGPCCDGTFPTGTVFGYSNPTIKNGVLVGGTLNTVVPLARNFQFKTSDDIFATGWNNKFQLTDEWTLTADLSYSKATRDETQYEMNAQYEPLPSSSPAPRNIYDTGSFNLKQGDMPSLSFLRDYTDPTHIQVGPTIYGAGWSKIPHVEDELTSGRVDAARTLENDWLSMVSFGVNYADRTKDKNQPEGGLSTLTGDWTQIGSKYLLSPMNLGYAHAGRALAWDVVPALHAYYNPVVYHHPDEPGYDWLIGKNWSVEEKVWTGYAKVDLNHELSSSVTLKGNIGLQAVNTDQSSKAFAKINGVTEPYTDGKTYTDWLPAMNLVFQLPDSQAVRFSYAEELARARMDQLKASSEFGWNQFDGKPSGSGGNPQLDPWKADAFDLSYEKYFDGNKGYVSAAAFYKNLKSYIYTQTDQNHDFSSVLADTTFPPGYFPPGVTPQDTGTFTSPVNGKGGDLYGFEFAVSVPFDVFTDVLDGFGANFSYSYTDSGIKIDDPPGNNYTGGNNLGEVPLPGLSKNVWNATLYYEKYGFSARIATRARSEYVGEVTNFANDRTLKYVDGEMITDAQLGYAFESGSLKGLSILFQVNNLTNEPYVAYSVNKTRVQDYQQYGTQYLLGVNYRL